MSSQTWEYFIAIIESAKELNKKEKAILVKRLKAKSLEKIGRKYKLTAERIRQIEKEALAKFKQKMIQLLLID